MALTLLETMLPRYSTLLTEELSKHCNQFFSRTDEGYQLFVELPGVSSENLNVEVVEGRTLNISGTRGESGDSHYAQFSRCLTLPANSDVAGISSTYTDGFLTVNIPFRVSEKINVPIN